MRKFSLISISVILWTISYIMGCGAVKPRIENGLYINTECQFAIRVPEGWTMSDKVNDIVRHGFPSKYQHLTKAVFSSPDGKSQIVLFAEKTKATWIGFNIISDQLINGFKKDDFAFSKNNHSSSIVDFNVFQDQIQSCIGHCKALAATLVIEIKKVKIKETINCILYESSDGMFSFAYLILIAGENRHDSDIKIFNTMVDSFEPR